MLLTQKAASLNWEPLSLDESGRFAAWVWFRPAVVPTGLMIVIPATLFADSRIAAKLSVRQLVAATSLDVSQILGWSVNGMNFDAASNSPLLDQTLPAPPPDGQVQLTVWMNVPQAMPQPMLWPVAAPAMADSPMPTMVGSSSPNDEQYFVAIDSTWGAIRQLEAKVGTMRKQLDQAVSRLNTLNRELTPEERRAADNKDTKDWLDARRWLRESLATLSRLIKEIDMGTTSGAGQRHHFESMHRQFVAPRIPFAGLQQAVMEFDTHAKLLQNVVSSAQTGLTRAGHDAEQRANGVLSWIGSKSRSTRK